MNTAPAQVCKLSRRLPAAALALLSLGAVSTSCATVTDECQATSPDAALVLIVGVHQNVPAPDVPKALACRLQATIATENPVTVIGVDGTPEVELAERFPVNNSNATVRGDDIERAIATVLGAVRHAAASSDGSALLAAVALAADQARSDRTPNAHLVLVDSGLADTGLDLTQPGLLGADPEEVANFLAEQGALPDLTGLSIELVGFGYATAPQEPLTQAMRDSTIKIWTAVLTRAGATSVIVTPVPRTGEGPDTSYSTRTVPIPEPTSWTQDTGGPIVYDDTSALGFQPNSTELRDPAAALATLQPLALWLVAESSRGAEIVGTTSSWGTEEDRATLSKERAEAIRVLVVGLGASPDQINTRGAGYTAHPPDRAPDGSLDPVAAARNRAVRITTTP
jgi:outer membrane protein OmpA-like peptidoglycan-associated protein